MYDLNYFSIIKQQKQKNKTLKAIAISIITIIIILNIVMLSIGLIAFRKLNNHIGDNQTYINAADTKAKVKEAKILNSELSIATEYLSIIKKTANQINQADLISVALIDHLRSLTPTSTYFISAQYIGSAVDLECYSTVTTDTFKFYHQLLQDDRFTKVSIDKINIRSDGVTTFTVRLILKGGDY